MNTYGAYFDLGLKSLVYEDAMYMDIENGVSSDEYYEDVGTGDDLDPVETNIFYEWEGAEDRLWTRYYKTTYTPGRKERYANQPGENQTYYAAEPIDESEAPESLRDAEYTLPLWGRANYVNHERQENATFDYDDTTNKRGWNETDHWCWVRPSVPWHREMLTTRNRRCSRRETGDVRDAKPEMFASRETGDVRDARNRRCSRRETVAPGRSARTRASASSRRGPSSSSRRRRSTTAGTAGATSRP